MFFERKIKGISFKEIGMTLVLYIVLSFLYKATLSLHRYHYKQEKENLFDFSEWFEDVGLQYMIMLIVASVIWAIIFRLCKKWKLWQRFLLHLITLPLFIWIVQQGYQKTSEVFDINYLSDYRQIWDFYILTLIYLIQFSIFHAYEYHTINRNKLKVEMELRHAALKSELTGLKAQLNPHFLYNIFNTINASIPAKMEDTREMIANLSDLFRYQLKASQKDLTPLRDEINFIKQYLKLEKRRFEERLIVEYDISEDLLDEMIPPMILQPIVENSVKHGISPLIEGGKISIVVRKKSNKIYFEIIDTGIGIKDKSEIFEKGVGLANTRLRLKKIYNSDIQIESNESKGLKVSFSI